jgi:hypothetical protein
MVGAIQAAAVPAWRLSANEEANILTAAGKAINCGRLGGRSGFACRAAQSTHAPLISRNIESNLST